MLGGECSAVRARGDEAGAAMVSWSVASLFQSTPERCEPGALGLRAGGGEAERR